ncbi:MAG: TolC family protein [Pseudomonadota bacterium]
MNRLSQRGGTVARTLARASTGLLGLLALGCSAVATDEYRRPDVVAPDGYRQAEPAALAAAQAIQPDWWSGFRDPVLNDLIDRSIAGNLDLRIAVARVQEAETAIGQVNAARLPSLTAGSNISADGARNPFTGKFSTTENYGANTQLSWELDTWGKLEQGVKARRAAYRASEADWRAVYLRTVSQVATSYFLLRQLDEQSDIQDRSLEAAQAALKIFTNQQREGLVSNTEVLRQQAEVTSIERGRLELQRQRDLAELTLATLLGVPADELAIATAPLTTTVQELPIPAGLPSELLSRRPDVVAAEYRVLEAHELVGQARLARLPSIRLTGNGNGGSDLASATLSTFVKSLTFGVGPSVQIPVFDPTVRARLRTTSATAQTREAEYRRAVLAAFQEVESALLNIENRRRQRDAIEAELTKLRQVAQQTQAQLELGLVNQLEVLESQRRLLAVDRAMLEVHQNILSDTVQLYKALGGGWDADVVAEAAL